MPNGPRPDIACFNCYRLHSAHKLTPAQTEGIPDHLWRVEGFLNW